MGYVIIIISWIILTKRIQEYLLGEWAALDTQKILLYLFSRDDNMFVLEDKSIL